jgi:hypothetical protein
MDYLTILSGLGAGIATAAIGYIKNMPDKEGFDWVKVIPTIVIGGIVGVIGAVANVTVDTATGMAASFGVVAFVNQGWSALVKWWNNRKTKTATKKK